MGRGRGGMILAVDVGNSNTTVGLFDQTGKLISEIMSPRLKHVLLGHLSRENNTPGLALETVQKEIELALGDDMLKKIDISVAPQDGMSALVEL